MIFRSHVFQEQGRDHVDMTKTTAMPTSIKMQKAITDSIILKLWTPSETVLNFKDRFDQPGYQTYKRLQQLLFKATNGQDYETELTSVAKLNGNDFDRHNLGVQLKMLKDLVGEEDHSTNCDIIKIFRGLSKAVLSSFLEIKKKLLTLIMVLPSTNAVSERSASAFRRVKTYLGTTMSQLRLNNLMMLSIHKDRTDQINLETVINEFVSASGHRINIFGRS